jgi:hypothetical protein
MFTFRCPGCGKQHVLEQANGQDFKQKCLRCGEVFHIVNGVVQSVKATIGSEQGRADSTATARPNVKEGVRAVPLPGKDLSDDFELTSSSGVAKTKEESVRSAAVTPRNKGPFTAEQAADGGLADDAQSEHEAPEDEDTFGLMPDLDALDEPKKRSFPKPPAEEEPLEPWQETAEEPTQDRRGPRRVFLFGIIAFVLLAGGTGAYLIFGPNLAERKDSQVKIGKNSQNTKASSSSSKATVTLKSTSKASVAKGSGKAADSKTATKTPEPKTPGKAPEPIVNLNEVSVAKLSTARLAAELAVGSEETKRKYEGRTLEVSGLFGKLETSNPPRGVFAVEGPVVACDLAGLDAREVGRWASLEKKQPITVRGVFQKDGQLHRCALLPLSAPADGKYAGKEIEIVGYIDSILPETQLRPFPTLRLEEDTDSRVDVDCLFRRSDEGELRKLKPGTLVIVRGTCHGRTREENFYHVRLDNCQLIYTSAPVGPIPRYDALQFERDYAEDLRTSLLPPLGTEPKVDATLTVAQLEQELRSNPEALEKKYRNKIIILSGVAPTLLPSRLLHLQSGNTDNTLEVYCAFTRHNLSSMGEGPNFVVQGLCTGLQAGRKTLRLENCEPFDPAAKDPRRLTADYLPHRPGQSLNYDVVVFSRQGTRAPTISRQVFYLKEGGVVEAMTTYKGTWAAGKSLLASAAADNWILNRNTKKVRLPGTTYQYRTHGGFVELGYHAPTKDEMSVETVWVPVLKIGARTGDTWKWSYTDARHTYTLVKFDEHGGRPAAVIKEDIFKNKEPDRRYQIHHLYVWDVGEVERQEAILLASGEKQILAEKRLVEDAGAGKGPAANSKTSKAKSSPDAHPELKAASKAPVPK